MQSNEIILSVDEDNTGTNPVIKTYTRYDEYNNRTVYTGDNHSVASKNTLGLYRTFPRSSGNFKGVAKTSAKITIDTTVVGNDGLAQLTVPVIGEVNFSIPVGVSAADQMVIRQTLISLLDDDTIMEKLMNKLEV